MTSSPPFYGDSVVLNSWLDVIGVPSEVALRIAPNPFRCDLTRALLTHLLFKSTLLCFIWSHQLWTHLLNLEVLLSHASQIIFLQLIFFQSKFSTSYIFSTYPIWPMMLVIKMWFKIIFVLSPKILAISLFQASFYLMHYSLRMSVRELLRRTGSRTKSLKMYQETILKWTPTCPPALSSPG